MTSTGVVVSTESACRVVAFVLGEDPAPEHAARQTRADRTAVRVTDLTLLTDRPNAVTADRRARRPRRNGNPFGPIVSRAVPAEDHVAAARAVYDASADTYVQFVGTDISAATEAPVDRSLLRAFVDLVKAGTSTRVADVGCGPGRVAAFLAAHHLDVVGLDPSPAMLAAARIAHPDIPFEEGQLDDLPIPEASLAGIVCWYSIIYTPPEYLVDAFSELARVLEPDGYLLLAFQAGTGEPVVRTDAHGTALSLTSFRHSLGDVTDRLEAAGFAVRATARRQPEFDHETTPQAFVVARRSHPS
jgi:SAM-dependent methyltransferase